MLDQLFGKAHEKLHPIFSMLRLCRVSFHLSIGCQTAASVCFRMRMPHDRRSSDMGIILAFKEAIYVGTVRLAVSSGCKIN